MKNKTLLVSPHRKSLGAWMLESKRREGLACAVTLREGRSAAARLRGWLCTVCGDTNPASASRCANRDCNLAFAVSGVIQCEQAKSVNRKRKADHLSRLEVGSKRCPPRAPSRSLCGRSRAYATLLLTVCHSTLDHAQLDASPMRRRVRAPPPPPPLAPSLAPGTAPSAAGAHATAASPRARRKMRPHAVVEIDISDKEGYAEARAAVTWQRLNAWANSKQRVVVRQRDLRRLFDFTTKLLLVRRRVDNELIGCALLCEAGGNQAVCDSLGPHANPSLPQVKTARMSSFGPIREAHIRAGFSRAAADIPIDELVLICGEAGTGAAVMAHLKGRHRLLFASVVPGSEQARRFYEKQFVQLNFERQDGELPFAAWLGNE